MPFPALAAVAPYLPALLSSLAGGVGGYLAGRGSNQSSSMPQMRGAQNMMAQNLPGGTTAVQMPRFAQGQQAGLQQVLQQGLTGLQNLPRAEFGPIKQSAMRQFEEDIVPGIAERFTGAGAGGQRSSAFEQALGGAGAGLSERLAAMEQGFNVQQRGQEQALLAQLLQTGLTPQFETAFIPPSQGFGTSLAGGVGTGVGASLPMLIQLLMSSLNQPGSTNISAP